MNKPFFSIVIPTYNRAELLRRCLDSVIKQTYTSWEAIVVDNFSEDNTEDVVASFGDPRIRFVKNHNHGVISVSRNKAIDMAQGQWICFLDSDDAWFPTKLEVIFKYTEKYDLIYHEYMMNIKRTRPFQRIKSNFYTIGDMSMKEVMRRGDPICPSCAAVSRIALGDTRFSEDKALFAVEDYDFFLQLIDKGLCIKHLKQALTHYDVSTGVSHGRIALDRDRRLYIKYLDKLSREDIREILKYYYLRKAGYFYQPGSYHVAMRYFAIAASAKDKHTRNKGLSRWLKAFILNIISKLK